MSQPTPGQPPGPPVAGLPQRTNGLAVAALITGLLGCLSIFGLILGVIALVQIRDTGERGRGLAIGGLVASVVWLVVLAVGFTTITGDDKPGRTAVTNLKVGDCFNGFVLGVQAKTVTTTPCDRDHDAQVLAEVSVPGEAFPGEAEVQRLAAKECGKYQVPLFKSPFGTRAQLNALYPFADGWGDRHSRVIKCVAVAPDGKLTGAIDLAKFTAGPNEKVWSKLREGDCFKEVSFPMKSPVVTTVSCNTPHFAQVVETLTLPAGPWPGAAGMTKQAETTCERRLTAAFKKHPPDQKLRQGYLAPDERSWAVGDRTVLCFVGATKGDLKKSVMPR